MESKNGEQIGKEFDDFLSRRPMPITGNVPNTIDELNKWGSIFAQNWARWLESQVCSVQATADTMIQISKDLKEYDEKLYFEVRELKILFQQTLSETRSERQKNQELISAQKEVIVETKKNNEAFKQEMTNDIKAFYDKTNNRWLTWVLGSIVASITAAAGILEVAKLMGLLH